MKRSLRYFLLIVGLLALLRPPMHAQGSLLLVGGGSEDYGDWSDQPYRWFVEKAANKTILVMDYSSGSVWLENYFRSLGAAKATSLSIPSTAVANDSAAYKTILSADGLFLRGGDQWQYVKLWKGTLTEKAIREVYIRGGVVGGTSAGEAVLGEIVFDARLTSVDPRTALRNPLGASITLTDDFLRLAPNLLADSHFFERGRLGRLAPMLSFYKKSKGREIAGLGIEYGTALAIGGNGVGEVMGSGPVSLLRFAADSKDTVEPSVSYSLRNMKLDLLTAGAKFNVSTSEIHQSATAERWNPKPFLSPFSLVILDGSGDSTQWRRDDGSLRKFHSVFRSNADTVAIISSPSSVGLAASVARALDLWGGVQVRTLLIDEASRNSSTFSLAAGESSGFIFLGNLPADRAWLMSDSTATGKAVRSRLPSSKAILLLGDDVMLAGEKGIGQMYLSPYGAYYGYLTLLDGLGLLQGVQCVPRIYENSDYIDNRMSALFWAMGKLRLPIGILLDVGTYAVIESNTIRVFGQTPAMVIDARSAQWVDFPAFRDPGKALPRQLSGFIGARFHVVRDKTQLDLSSLAAVPPLNSVSYVPDHLTLEQNYPNPFNPATAITYQMPKNGPASLRVYDILGRMVVTLVDGAISSGRHTVTWDASGCPSGVYFYRLVVGAFVQTRKLVLLK